MEKAFCRAYVANGGDGNAAAVTAGYSTKGSNIRAMAHKLLKRPEIQAEIARLIKSTQGVVEEVTSKALSVINQHRPTGADPIRAAMYAEAERDIALGLTRAYVIAGLIDNFEMALGRRARKVTRFITERVRNDKGVITSTVKGVQVEEFIVDHSGANRAGELLLAECSRAEGLPATTETGEANHILTPTLELFLQGHSFEIPAGKPRSPQP